ncbi:hypothetical protein QQS21_002820 [Conoideocrella luteorostrata]|uniref:P-loop containing nucleoside triphosphate hydrolase protein n=1 Tax=Conoideocrella luteorostrata TaxID=1105319 RepID=A0AAJ0CUB8_9HYPO|nr:hypothetical protein QQS21_002820 [Conoideocrella luteorostrata]
MANSTQQLACGDDSLGPGVKSAACRGGFDFTVLFEEAVFAILPASLFLLLAPFQVISLVRGKIRLRRNAIYLYKLTAAALYALLQLSLLITITKSHPRNNLVVASAAVSLLSGVGLGFLSHLEHLKSIRPSFLITAYLLASVVLDIARIRTRWLGRDDVVASILTASLGLKCVMIVLEAVDKRGLLGQQYQRISLESTSGFISRSLFLWLNPLLASGYKNVLTNDDLPHIHEKLNSETLAERLQTRWDTCNQKSKYALALSCARSLPLELAKIVLPKFAVVGLSVSQAFLIKSAVEYVQGFDDDTKSTDVKNYGYGLIGAFFLVYFGLALTIGWTSHLTSRLEAMMRGQLITVVYNKLVTLPKVSQSAALTLMGTDANRISTTYHFILVDVVPAIVQLGVAIYLLYWQLGAVCVAPILILLLTTGLSSIVTSFVSARQSAWIKDTQRRVNYSTNILGSLRNVKMLGLTDQMSSNIQAMRDDEMKSFRRSEVISTLGIAVANMPGWTNPLALFAAYGIVAKLSGVGGLSVSQAITSLSLLNLIDTPLSQLSYAITAGWASMSCFARIQEFLMETPRLDHRLVAGCSAQDGHPASTEAAASIELGTLRQSSDGANFAVTNGSFGWSESASATVRNINIAVRNDTKLTMIIGPVGCGKSTMLRGLLGETTIQNGTVVVASTKIAYCDQTPWIMSGSVRDNILAGNPYEEGWYRTVVHACVLDVDIRSFADGDATIVGSKGMKLSGGQKQRLSIARAVYSRCDLAICDDVLSGLDANTEQIIMRRVFSANGLFEKTGTPVILATHSVKHMPVADMIIALDNNGLIIGQGKCKDVLTSDQFKDKLGHLFQDESAASDSGDEDSPTAESEAGKSKNLSQKRKTGDWKTYKFYFLDVLGTWRTGTFLALAACNSTCEALLSVWINWWASSNQQGKEPRLGYWLGVYTFLSIAKGCFQILSLGYLFVYLAPRGCSILHKRLLQAAMRAPLSYISATDTGDIINRFTRDLNLSELAIPGTIINVVLQLGSCVVVVALSINATSYFAIILPVIIGVLFLVQRFYLKTSRQLRLLEIEANAPLVTHFIESLSGLITIRAFGWTEAYMNKAKRLIYTSQKPAYLLLCIQQWLVLVLDLVVAAMAVVLVGLAVALRSKLNGGALGIALVSMMQLSHALTNLVQAWTSLETSFGAIARIKDFYENTPTEESPGESSSPDLSWPSVGVVRFESVSATYSAEESPILTDITATIEAGQKIGLVGRTGSGKTSLTLALMRMIDVVSGSIYIDGVDLATLRGSVVRDRLGCLAQDPLLLPSSIRANIDPLGISSDVDIINALIKVNLWTFLCAKANKAGSRSEVLDAVIDEDDLSHGQRQLFCLARAIIKPGKVLILDEPTSSVDMETEAEMQRIIREEFSKHTIIMIAHRLSSLHDFDKILVLESGRVVESGKPSELLKDKSSRFAKLSQISL